MSQQKRSVISQKAFTIPIYIWHFLEGVYSTAWLKDKAADGKLIATIFYHYLYSMNAKNLLLFSMTVNHLLLDS